MLASSLPTQNSTSTISTGQINPTATNTSAAPKKSGNWTITAFVALNVFALIALAAANLSHPFALAARVALGGPVVLTTLALLMCLGSSSF